MNEEVKEILDRLNNIPMGELYACCLEDSECKTILEYITNLRKENEELDDYAKQLEFKIKILATIVDNAFEYSKNCLKNLATINEEEAQPFKCIHNNYLKILNGDDNE